MKIVAIRDMSDGNEETGEAWQETKIFDSDDKIIDVVRWAVSYGQQEEYVYSKLKKRVQITVPHGEIIV